MQYIDIPEFTNIRGGKAKNALCQYIIELKEKEKESPKKQIDALVKIAQGLISAIEAESSSTIKPLKPAQTGLIAAIQSRFSLKHSLSRKMPA